MRNFLFSIISLMCFTQYVLAQPASFSNPLGIGRNRCGSGSGNFIATQDSLFYFNYTSPNLTNSITPITACQPKFKTNYAPLNTSGYSTIKPFNIFAASISFNPADQMVYYVWTDYNIPAPYKSYIWRWDPVTCPISTTPGLDTLRTFNTDIGGITFDASGIGWQLEFSGEPVGVPHTATIRPINFNTGYIGNRDTLDLTAGKKIYDVGTGDITLTPSGQMYFVFNNKLFTPDYGSWVGNGHIKCTYIDTIKKPTGSTGLPGLAFGNGDLIAAYSPGCLYRKINGVTGDTSFINYSGYALNKGVASYDLTAINSGIGPSKKLISVTATGTSGQYDVVYDVYTRNYGNVPLKNVQVTDDLKSINGLANVSNVTAVFTGNPAGVTLNPGYNGTSDINLLTGTDSLKCYPVAINNFTIRISCRLSNILSGVVYNNSAIATALGFKNVALRDSSTNGSNPDLNQNDKTDDFGEGQPTPFVIVITPVSAPCAVIGNIMYNQTFGTGSTLVGAIPPLPAAPPYPAIPSASSTYIGAALSPLAVNRFTVTDTARKGDIDNWIRLRDHTGNLNGRMLLVNADASASIMYRDTLPVACPGQQYSVVAWASFIGNDAYKTVCDGLGGFKFPKLLIQLRDLATGLTITQSTTVNIIDSSWHQFGMKFVLPPGYSNMILEIINAGTGGCGNDVAIDDIQFGNCSADPTVNINGLVGGCLGSSTTFTSTLSDTTAIPGGIVYQWQIANLLAGPYINIAGATSANYTIPAIAGSDTGKYYRVIVAATGNMGIPSCQYISPGILLTGKAPSSAATTATKSKNNICPGISVNLGITGGNLGANASWKWYTGTCGTTLLGTGTSITVSPTVTTTYYVRAEGDCNTTACQQVTVFISCDIDKDKDGIPDFVESNMAAAFLDVPANGIINAYDPLTPGFVDYNNDYVNDNYQADGDSDNDGIPNYLDTTFPGRVDTNSDGIDDRFDTDKDGIINILDLDSDNDGITDVVEAYGVDTDGNGKIDNFADTDGDGLSDNVDSRINLVDGAYNTGIGLGLPNLDGDAVPNFLDLDSDNDGIPDVVETGGPDVNNNGIIDAFVDANGDGLHDGYINVTALLKTGSDINGDGRADSYTNKNLDRDFRPNAYDMDSDGDGIVDVIEAGLPDVDLNGIVDGAIATNGWSTLVSALPLLNLRNTDAIGNADYLDIDSDDDGIPDNIEGQTTVGYKMPTLIDFDGDGLVDTYETAASRLVFGGSGIFVYDHDADGTPDYRDLDSDADGLGDRVEGNDFNLNGLPDDNVTLTGLDTDADGLDNRYDSLNSVTNIKGTSYRLGNGGTFSGDAAPGSRTTVQKTNVYQTDRDWRYSGYVLPVQLLNFSGSHNNNKIVLSWTIIADKEIDRFEIERSTNNRNFCTVITNRQAVALQIQQSFSVTDDIANVNSDIIYYRLKVIGKAGEIKYSQVLVFKTRQTLTKLTISPNPAKDYAIVSFYAEQDYAVTIRLINNSGKIMGVNVLKAVKGKNLIPLQGLAKYSSGSYTLQVNVNEVVLSEKLIIIK